MPGRFTRVVLCIAAFGVTWCAVAAAQPRSMVLVPAGEFPMGNAWNEGSINERPVHSVYLDTFWIDPFEVTNAQFAVVLNWVHQTYYLRDEDNHHYGGGDVYYAGKRLIEIDSRFCAIVYNKETNRFWVPPREGRAMFDHPVVMVTWYGAANYCNWRSEMDGLTPCYSGLNAHHVFCNFAAEGYRLPTEAEWEKAASFDPGHIDPVAGPRWRYGFMGALMGFARANYYDPVRRQFNNPLGLEGQPFTAPVGFFNGSNRGTVDSPSSWGCYDMSGNVWEWCWDWYESGYYERSPYRNPRGPWEKDDRIVRGGSWLDVPDNLRATRRAGWPPRSADAFVGFRTVRIPPTPADLAVEGFDFSPEILSPGDPIHFSGRVVNTGTHATGPFWMNFHAVPAPLLPAQLPPLPPWPPPGGLAPFLCAPMCVSEGLMPGQHLDLSAIERTVHGPTEGLLPGIYFVSVVVDPLNEVAESNELNNIALVRDRLLHVAAPLHDREGATNARNWPLYR